MLNDGNGSRWFAVGQSTAPEPGPELAREGALGGWSVVA